MRVERRLTIDQIAERLALPRTTIFYWVRDLTVPRSKFDPRPMTAARARAARANSRKHAAIRHAAYQRGASEFAALCEQDSFRDFVCLYLAEGYRRNRNNVGLGNSDPAVVALADRWIRRFARNPVTYSVQYHADQDLGELQEFWGGLLSVAPATVKMQRKSNSGQLGGRTWRSRYGVLSVRCCDTLFRARLQAWMDLLRASWA